MIQGPTAVPPVPTHSVDTPRCPPSSLSRCRNWSRASRRCSARPRMPSGTKGPSAIGELVAKEDAAVRATADRINATLETDKVKPMEEILVDAMRIQMEAAATMTKIHMGSMVAHSGKNAVQTLMKNQ